jgi:hypothetical protein
MDAHARSMIAVSGPPTALSAVLRTETAIMERTAKGAPAVFGRREAASAQQKVPRSAKVLRFHAVWPFKCMKRSTFSDLEAKILPTRPTTLRQTHQPRYSPTGEMKAHHSTCTS